MTITSVGVVYDDGDDVSFTCTSEGGPDNTLQWFKDGTDVTDMIEGSENNLTLYNISADGDGGVYECRASNAAGMGSASVTLYVSPMFIMQPLDQNITDGENVSFTCIATAFPPAEYMWYRVEGDLPESATGGNTSTLTLSPAVFGDQGQYYCNATSNDILISSDIVTLTSKSLILPTFLLLLTTCGP